MPTTLYCVYILKIPFKYSKILMPMPTTLYCVWILNIPLKYSHPTPHNLVLCVDIENTLKILKNTHAPCPQPCTVCRY